MMMIKKLNLVLLSTFILILVGCGGNNNEPSPEDNGMDRKEILVHWADNIIIPAYAGYKLSFDAMKQKGDAFIAAPETNTLSEFRIALSQSYQAWQRVELFEFAAADRYTLRNFFNIYPADMTGIQANIDDASADLEVPSSYARQGYPALDYLINGLAADDAAILEMYSTAENAANRKAYVGKLLTRMNTLLSNVITEWSGSSKDKFVTSTGLDIGSSMGVVVNAYVLHYERYIRSGKIGIPAGVMTSTPNPEKIEALYNREISLLLAKEANNAAYHFFNGKKDADQEVGPSFKSYLDALDAKDAVSGKLLSTIINEQFEIITQKLNMLDADLYQQIETDNEAMVSLYADMQKLVRLLKVDMTSAMSVTITYTDSDGD